MSKSDDIKRDADQRNELALDDLEDVAGGGSGPSVTDSISTGIPSGVVATPREADAILKDLSLGSPATRARDWANRFKSKK